MLVYSFQNRMARSRSCFLVVLLVVCEIVSFTRSFVPSSSPLVSSPSFSSSLFGTTRSKSRSSSSSSSTTKIASRHSFYSRTTLLKAEGEGTTENEVPLSKAPSFNGKTVFPVKVFMNGLKGHQVAAVYAILNKNYKRGGEGWEHVQHIAITKDLYKDIEHLQTEYSPYQVAHVRALSFVYPQKSAMEEVANKWRNTVMIDYGSTVSWDEEASTDHGNDETMMTEKEKLVQLMKDTAVYDDDDDDDDDEFEFYDDEDTLPPLFVDATKASTSSSTTPTEETKIDDEITTSPFENSDNDITPAPLTDSDGQLIFNSDNVNKVLDEIRPYLINDGGNVSVQKVDEETRSVYLKLEGACGNCASSTVTMSMGITRVLKENFENLGEVVQVEDGDGEENGSGEPKSLTEDAVMAELNRIGPAISAMGGVVEVVNVDPIGVVELRFRGSTKIQQGLELALRDVPYVKHVKFVS